MRGAHCGTGMEVGALPGRISSLPWQSQGLIGPTRQALWKAPLPAEPAPKEFIFKLSYTPCRTVSYQINVPILEYIQPSALSVVSTPALSNIKYLVTSGPSPGYRAHKGTLA